MPFTFLEMMAGGPSSPPILDGLTAGGTISKGDIVMPDGSGNIIRATVSDVGLAIGVAINDAVNTGSVSVIVATPNTIFYTTTAAGTPGPLVMRGLDLTGGAMQLANAAPTALRTHAIVLGTIVLGGTTYYKCILMPATNAAS